MQFQPLPVRAFNSKTWRHISLTFLFLLLGAGQMFSGAAVAADPLPPLQPQFKSIELGSSRITRRFVLVPLGMLQSQVIPGTQESQYDLSEEWLTDPANWALSVGTRQIPLRAEDIMLANPTNIRLFLDRAIDSGWLKKSDPEDPATKLAVELRLQKLPATTPPSFVKVSSSQMLAVPRSPLRKVDVALDYGPNQELLGGAQKAVGQVKINLDMRPSLKFPFYLRSQNVISTQGKDVASQLQLILGQERLRGRRQYNTFYEARYQGNQIFSNKELVFAAGVRRHSLWRWGSRPSGSNYVRSIYSALSSPALAAGASLPLTNATATDAAPDERFRAHGNFLIRAKVPAEFTIGAEYAHWLSTDPLAPASHNSDNNFRLTSEISWDLLHLLPGRFYDDNDITLGLVAKGWYLPSEKGTAGSKARKFEGNLGASILIPLSKVGVEQGLRLTYRTGANESNKFERSSDFTFAFEASK